jgi:hypothetical protein
MFVPIWNNYIPISYDRSVSVREFVGGAMSKMSIGHISRPEESNLDSLRNALKELSLSKQGQGVGRKRYIKF